MFCSILWKCFLFSLFKTHPGSAKNSKHKWNVHQVCLWLLFYCLQSFTESLRQVGRRKEGRYPQTRDLDQMFVAERTLLKVSNVVWSVLNCALDWVHYSCWSGQDLNSESNESEQILRSQLMLWRFCISTPVEKVLLMLLLLLEFLLFYNHIIID